MVFLNRIYTKSGDDGTTGLGNGDRLSKTHPRIRAYGSVDELNSVIGVVRALGKPAGPIESCLEHIQNDLFDVGADLCIPEADEAEESEVEQKLVVLRILESQVTRLENWIDQAVEQLTPLTSFILPGGSSAAAFLHLARSVCRRTEIDVLQLAEFEPINPQLTIYLNRLSDLLFVWARLSNDLGRGDILWKPGAGRT